MKLKAIIRNINWLNILLMVAIALFANYIFLPIFDIKASYMPPSVKKGSEEKKQEVSQEVQIPTPLEYAVIADQNLFHPERKIPIEKVEQQPLPKPEFVLYGTLITDGLSIAYLEDLKAPFTTPGRGKRQRAIRTGDSMSGFTLKEIETDKIVMLKGEERMVISMNDPSHPKTRESVATTASAIPGPQGTKPVTQPITPGGLRVPATTTTSAKQPVRQAPVRIPPQQGTTSQTDLLKQGPHSIKNAPYTPSPNSSGSRGLLGIPR